MLLIAHNNFMKILYVKYGIIPRYYRNRYKLRSPALNTVKCYVLAYAARFIFKFRYRIIDAFFEASLRAVGKVKEVSAWRLKRMDASAYDVVVVHHRYDGNVSHSLHNESLLAGMVEGSDCYKILYINDDIPEPMYSDTVIDCYDLVVKREPFKDLSRYNLTEVNRKKIIPTALGCMVFSSWKISSMKIRGRLRGAVSSPNPQENDLFFLGKATDGRLELWRGLCDRYRCSGGLLPRLGVSFDKKLLGKKLGYCDYIKSMANAKISLAIGGHGPFTFRHLEILALGCFLLCPDEINEISLPIPLVEGEHYITYSDQTDLLNKIEWYLAHASEREKIAENGRALFFEYYDSCVHGSFIRDKVRC